MKKIILPIIILSLLFGVVSFAQEAEPPSPGLTPDSPFYFLDTLGEKIGMFFTFGAEKKAERALQYAEEKLAEVKAMAEKNKPESAEKANQGYQDFLSLANAKTQEAKEQGKDVEELATLIIEKTLRHQEILVEVFEKVPEEVKDAIQKAIEVSRRGSEEAVEAVTGAKKEELQQKIEEVLIIPINWKTYRNEKYGYFFKYPLDCFYGPMPVYCKEKPPEERPPECLCFLDGENPDRVFLQAFTDEKDNLTLATFEVTHYNTSLYNPPPGTDLIEWLKEKFASYKNIPDKPNTEIDEIPAVRVYEPGGAEGTAAWFSGEDIYFIKNDMLFIISMLDVDSESNKELYDQILSTFKFIELEEAKEEAPEIEEVPKVEEKPYIKVISPNGGETWKTGNIYNITWTSKGVEKVNILLLGCQTKECTVETGMSMNAISPHYSVDAEEGSYSWAISSQNIGLDVSKYTCFKIKIYEAFPGPEGVLDKFLAMLAYIGNKLGILLTQTSDLVEDVSDECFYIIEEKPAIEEKITVNSPNGGEEWVIGETHEITWTSVGVDKVNIKLLTYYNGVESFTTIATDVSASLGKYSWTIPDFDPAGSRKIGVISTESSQTELESDWDWSDSYFSIVEPSITVTSPNGGEIWQLHSIHKITWTPNPESAYVQAYLEKMENGDFITAGKIIPVGKGSIQWDGEIDRSGNYATPGNYYIKLVNTKTAATDRSDESFQLVAANDFVKADLKIKSVDGTYSDGPVTVETRTIQVSWSSAVADVCRLVASSKDTRDVTSFDNLATGAVDKQILLPGNKDAYYVELICDSSLYGGNTSGDLISVNILCPLPETPVLTDPGISVNSGESFALSWTGFIGGTLQRDTDPTFSNPRGVYAGQSLSPAETTTYYYRVNACNDCGCSSWSNVVDMKVIVPSITVISPNGGEEWIAGQTYDITWEAEGIQDNVEIYLRDDRAGPAYELIATELSPSLRKYSWIISSDITSWIGGSGSTFKIQIRELGEKAGGGPGEGIFDESDDYFSIIPSITVTSPNGGEMWKIGETYRVTWNSVGVDSVHIYINDPSIFGSGSTNYITPNGLSIASAPGYYDWTISSKQLPGGGGNNYKIRIFDADDATAQDYSDDFFTITPYIYITSPNGGEVWAEGATHRIEWDTVGEINSIWIEYWVVYDDGSYEVFSVDRFANNPGYYDWTIPDLSTKFEYNYKIRIFNPTDTSIQDYSDDYFQIGPSPPAEP